MSGTGTSSLPRGFSRQGLRALRYCPSLPVPRASPARGFPSAPPPPVGRPLPLGRSRLLPASPRRSIAATWYGILYPLSFAYALRPPLRPRLTLGGRAFPRNPWVFGGLDSHQSYRYSYRHSHSPALHQASRPGFPAPGTLPYPGRTLSVPPVQASVARLAPLHFPRRHTRPVSYYALFQGWLLLSQPPGCLRVATSFPTQRALRDLSCGSGLLPSRPRILAPAV